MILYKILHIPTGSFVCDNMLLLSPRKAIEVLRLWYDYSFSGDIILTDIDENIAPEIFALYKDSGNIPDIAEFEIIAVQT